MKQLILFSIFSLLMYSGCEKGTVRSPNNVITDSNKSNKDLSKSNLNEIKQKIFKGIYSEKNKTRNFRDCISKKDFIITADGDIAEIDKQYHLNSNNTENYKIYLELEGFISEQSNKKSNKMDTVLIVTKFIKADTGISCD